MILISIYPYPVKKILLVIAGLICLSSVCFADAFYLSVNSTPYDRQMARIRSVLFTQPEACNHDLSLVIVNHWIKDLRAIPYGFSPQWKTPSEVETSPAADCKGKAVALYYRMQAQGADNVRLVIGKRAWTSRKTHAWLEWTTDSGKYVLDPTIKWAACRADRLGNRSYLALYAYAGPRKYRAVSTGLYASN